MGIATDKWTGRQTDRHQHRLKPIPLHGLGLNNINKQVQGQVTGKTCDPSEKLDKCHKKRCISVDKMYSTICMEWTGWP